jgi:hypothetical protein
MNTDYKNLVQQGETQIITSEQLKEQKSQLSHNQGEQFEQGHVVSPLSQISGEQLKEQKSQLEHVGVEDQWGGKGQIRISFESNFWRGTQRSKISS